MTSPWLTSQVPRPQWLATGRPAYDKMFSGPTAKSVGLDIERKHLIGLDIERLVAAIKGSCNEPCDGRWWS